LNKFFTPHNDKSGKNVKKESDNIEVEYISDMEGFSVHSDKKNCEEDSLQKIFKFIQTKQLSSQTQNYRLFGRNTYPTEKPKPYGYEVILLVVSGEGPKISESGEIKKKILPSAKYAVLKGVSLSNIVKKWNELWKWVDQNHFQRGLVKKEEFGWVLGLEEITNWSEVKNPRKFIFTLWAPIQP
jgi:hypothetical protein